MSKAVIVASGGMDSATLAWSYKAKGHDLILVGFDYGQRHRKELDSLERIGWALDAETRIVDLRSLTAHLHGSALTDAVEVPDGHYAEETMRATVVPNRNAIFLAIATGIAVAEKAELVATGIHAGDHFIYPDCRPTFFDPFALAMQAGSDGFTLPDFRLEAPFIRMSKAEIARLGVELEVDFSITWSCYKGSEQHCGRCGTCVERWEAFATFELEDPTSYEDPDFARAAVTARGSA
jgi:7-cyano-7-deazaguanine synthase